MSWIEVAAALMGLLSVGLTIRQSIWCWPTGLVMVTLYIFVFYDAKLYSDMLLQVVYIFMQLYGWYYWMRGQASQPAMITTLSFPARLMWSVATAFGTGMLGYVMGQHTDAAVPYWDATTTVLSLVAQWLLGRKVLENWILWILVDVFSIGIYVHRELYLTAGLYVVFLGMAASGMWAWTRAYRDQQPA
jgi:nicotinamide mononucleotide transporter